MPDLPTSPKLKLGLRRKTILIPVLNLQEIDVLLRIRFMDVLTPITLASSREHLSRLV